ncbi:purine nucleosidase [Angomonas deanei]|nr:purine nucleosidase [Angomonas deanei]EPY42110.1 purine nucleosidase [Angomonas deanei]|eukprot:EPY39045.1 purine nucleosidase [Angomonas deanei]
MPKKIILDCDPGLDDAVAILLAHGNPDIELLAVTTVVGNQTLEKVSKNALYVAEVAGMTGVRFAAGCVRPLVRPVTTAGDIHGESGLGGVQLPDHFSNALEPTHAVQLIIELIMSHEPHTITLVPTGGLTNIAMAARLEPRIVDRVKEVVLMGGGCHYGNRTPVAEFNIYIDPEAAHVVFNGAWKVTMVGLDLTYQARATDEVVAKIAAVNTNVSSFVLQLFEFYNEMYKKKGLTFAAVHDPCAVAYVIDPSLMEVRKAKIDVELSGALTTGMTVVDLRGPEKTDLHTQVAMKLDVDRFWNLVVDALQRIGNTH